MKVGIGKIRKLRINLFSWGLKLFLVKCSSLKSKEWKPERKYFAISARLSLRDGVTFNLGGTFLGEKMDQRISWGHSKNWNILSTVRSSKVELLCLFSISLLIGFVWVMMTFDTPKRWISNTVSSIHSPPRLNSTVRKSLKELLFVQGWEVIHEIHFWSRDERLISIESRPADTHQNHWKVISKNLRFWGRGTTPQRPWQCLMSIGAANNNLAKFSNVFLLECTMSITFSFGFLGTNGDWRLRTQTKDSSIIL